MTAAKAKRLLSREMGWHGITFDHVTARTVFLKSRRGQGDAGRLVVTVHGFVDEPRARAHLIEYGRDHSFGVELHERSSCRRRTRQR